MQSAVSEVVTCITGTELEPAAGIPSRITQSPPPPSLPKKQKLRNPIMSDQCSYTTYRSTDIKGHMLSQAGNLPTCQIGTCKT